MLKGNQKRFLRALAVNKNALFQIGKDNLNANLFESISQALKKRELVKIKVLKTCELSINEIAIEICCNCSCELVQIIGKTLVVYKKSKERIIELP